MCIQRRFIRLTNLVVHWALTEALGFHRFKIIEGLLHQCSGASRNTETEVASPFSPSYAQPPIVEKPPNPREHRLSLGSRWRYILKIHFFIESGLKMIQFKIQFKTKSRIFIQQNIHSIESRIFNKIIHS